MWYKQEMYKHVRVLDTFGARDPMQRVPSQGDQENRYW